MAAQEQALRPWWFRSQIQKEDVSPKCRLCDVRDRESMPFVSWLYKALKGTIQEET